MISPFPWMLRSQLELSKTRENEFLETLAKLEASRTVLQAQLRPILHEITEVEREIGLIRTWREQAERLTAPLVRVPATSRAQKRGKPKCKAFKNPASMSPEELQSLISMLQSLQA